MTRVATIGNRGTPRPPSAIDREHLATTGRHGELVGRFQLLVLCCGLALSAALIAPPTAAMAFNCGSGWSNYQKDAWYQPNSSYALHGWLGNCYAGSFYSFYGGQDSHWSYGGSWHNVSYMSTRLRAWCSGALEYDNTTTGSNTAYQQLTTPQYGYCSPQSNVTGYQTVYNQWSWSWQLSTP